VRSVSDEAKTINDDTIFWVTNHHAEAPPAWVSSSTEGRRGYVENEYGEQWFAQATKDLFRFTGGDIGWRTVSVSKPDYRRLVAALDEAIGSRAGGFEDVILGIAEKYWMRAMLLTAATAPPDQPL
jgi:hypothetical protein